MKKIILSAFITLFFTACSSSNQTQKQIGMPNPASQYCVDSGGESKMRSDNDGVYGICILKNGTTVDEWQYYRAHH